MLGSCEYSRKFNWRIRRLSAKLNLSGRLSVEGTHATRVEPIPLRKVLGCLLSLSCFELFVGLGLEMILTDEL